MQAFRVNFVMTWVLSQPIMPDFLSMRLVRVSQMELFPMEILAHRLILEEKSLYWLLLNSLMEMMQSLRSA